MKPLLFPPFPLPARGLTRALVLACLLGAGVFRPASAGPAAQPDEWTISLAGSWKFSQGAPATGDPLAPPPVLSFADTIDLPGTTETNRKGPENPDHGQGGLTRLYRFNGPAWYQRDFVVPPAWEGRALRLFLERTKYTQVWVDGKPCGENRILCTPQEYDLGSARRGPHVLTILVDNARKPLACECHQTSDNTQGNWNGLIGRIELQARPLVRLENVLVRPDAKAKAVLFEAVIARDPQATGKARLAVSIEGPGLSVSAPVREIPGAAGPEETVGLSISLGNKARLWDEFHPVLYRAKVRLEWEAGADQRIVSFGLREFGRQGTQFTINGRPTFLRGKHDACVFPLTGHPPMDTEGWLRYFAILRDYGLNHVRFHTWTPPEAAFEAADRLGFYLQPELPFWGSYGAKERAVLQPEAERILRQLGHHPSFVMMSLGNECTGDRTVMASMVARLREVDPQRLYAQGSNNFLWDPRQAGGDDYWTTARTKSGEGAPLRNVRGSFATVDGGNGHVQVGPPGTMTDYAEALAGVTVPVVGHEIGQFTVYPDFREIAKYTGVLRPRNLEHWRDKLAAAGMLDQAGDFFRASGRLAAICYREDIEAALRTPGFGGFQMLDLQDFPGQGTALVGMLDAFLDSKGLVSPEEWRGFCGPMVLLAQFPKREWRSGESFTARVDLAHYGEHDLAQAAVDWTLADTQGHRLGGGRLEQRDVKQGGLREIGRITVPLAAVRQAARVDLTLKLDGQPVANRYSVWVYPPPPPSPAAAAVRMARRLGAAEREALARGDRVLLIPEKGHEPARSTEGGFATDFWCWPMFHNKPGTMGILCDPGHPALAGFPTDFHSDWQWFAIASASRPVILDGPAARIKPIVQVIDNLDRVHKLGLVFEAKVGPGKLLVCACDLPSLSSPAAACLLDTLQRYAASGRFDPQAALDPGAARELLEVFLPAVGRAEASTSESPEHDAAKATDGDAATRWCASSVSPDQWWKVDLGSPRRLQGCLLEWESERADYKFVLERSADGKEWSTLAEHSSGATPASGAIFFPPAEVRHLRVRVTGLPKGLWASLREVRILEAE